MTILQLITIFEQEVYSLFFLFAHFHDIMTKRKPEDNNKEIEIETGIYNSSVKVSLICM